MVIVAHDLRGLVFWPLDEVAMVRTEHAGRLEVTHGDGSVAHRPGPLADWVGPPLVEVRPGLHVHPARVQVRAGRLHAPGGWVVPDVTRVGRPRKRPTEKTIPELGVRPSEVLYVLARGWESVLVTDRGNVAAPGHLLGHQAAALIPGVVRATRDYHVNLSRLRRVRPEPQMVHILEFDDGRTEIRLWWAGTQSFKRALGLTSLRHAGYANPGQRVLHREGLRNWPFVLADAPAEVLKAHFGGDERRLLGNMALQAYMAAREAWPVTWGRPHRGLYYRPVLPVLRRMGLLVGHPGWLARGKDDPEWMARGAVDPHYTKLCLVLTALVSSGVFSYSDLGWEEPRPEMRGIGARHPRVLLLVEKGTLEQEARWLHRTLGISFKITGGLPSFIATEHLVKALREATREPLIVVALVDWDPYGAIIRDSFCDQLRHYGMTIERVVDLVRPDRFTPTELEELSLPLSYDNPRHQGLLENWVRETGGIGGLAFGINSDGLRPVERLAGLVRGEVGLVG